MIISAIAGVPLPRVPVSTAETRLSKNETQPVTITPHLFDEVGYSVLEAINCLIDAGFVVGVDGELLPPQCFVKQLRGIGA